MYERYNSITRAEYEKARKNGMPIFIFVDKGVYSEYQTYKRNRENESIKYSHVDNINIFKLLDDILSQKLGHYIKDFEKFEDIESWLTEQWAGLFTNYLIYKNTESKIKTIESQIEELKSITIALKKYTEALMEQIIPTNYEKIIDKENKNILAEKVMNSLLEEGFVRTILREFQRENGIELKSDKLIEAFSESKDLGTFLDILHMSIGHSKEFLSVYKNDFKITRKRLLNTLSEIQILEKIER
jgi:hypothetical protein